MLIPSPLRLFLDFWLMFKYLQERRCFLFAALVHGLVDPPTVTRVLAQLGIQEVVRAVVSVGFQVGMQVFVAFDTRFGSLAPGSFEVFF